MAGFCCKFKGLSYSTVQTPYLSVESVRILHESFDEVHWVIGRSGTVSRG